MRLVALGQLAYELVALGTSRRIINLFVRGAWTPDTNVLKNARIEQELLLRNVRNLIVESFKAVVADVALS